MRIRTKIGKRTRIVRKTTKRRRQMWRRELERKKSKGSLMRAGGITKDETRKMDFSHFKFSTML
jgi:hypothetical protein